MTNQELERELNIIDEELKETRAIVAWADAVAWNMAKDSGTERVTARIWERALAWVEAEIRLNPERLQIAE